MNKLSAIERHQEYYLTFVQAHQGEWQQTEAIYGQIDLAYQRIVAPEKMISFLQELNTYQELRGLSKDRISWNERGLQLINREEAPQEASKLLNNLGNAYFFLSQYEQAIDYFQQALIIRRKIGDLNGEAATLANLGNAQVNLGKYAQAVAYYEQSLAIRRQTHDRKGEGVALGNLAIVYRKMENYEQAIDCYEQSIVIARTTGNRKSEGIVSGNLAMAHRHLQNFEQALVYQQQALTIAQELGDRFNEGNWLGGLGLIYFEWEKHYERALDYYQQALQIARETNYQLGEGIHLNNIGNCYRELRQMDKACAFWTQALLIFETINSPHVAAVRNSLMAGEATNKAQQNAVGQQ